MQGLFRIGKALPLNWVPKHLAYQLNLLCSTYIREMSAVLGTPFVGTTCMTPFSYKNNETDNPNFESTNFQNRATQRSTQNLKQNKPCSLRVYDAACISRTQTKFQHISKHAEGYMRHNHKQMQCQTYASLRLPRPFTLQNTVCQQKQ